jgi:hypothetical protein
MINHYFRLDILEVNSHIDNVLDVAILPPATGTISVELAMIAAGIALLYIDPEEPLPGGHDTAGNLSLRTISGVLQGRWPQHLGSLGLDMSGAILFSSSKSILLRSRQVHRKC